jgi:hypothetical protein
LIVFSLDNRTPTKCHGKRARKQAFARNCCSDGVPRAS